MPGAAFEESRPGRIGAVVMLRHGPKTKPANVRHGQLLRAASKVQAARPGSANANGDRQQTAARGPRHVASHVPPAKWRFIPSLDAVA
jgi:hypothetical protein